MLSLTMAWSPGVIGPRSKVARSFPRSGSMAWPHLRQVGDRHPASVPGESVEVKLRAGPSPSRPGMDLGHAARMALPSRHVPPGQPLRVAMECLTPDAPAAIRQTGPRILSAVALSRKEPSMRTCVSLVALVTLAATHSSPSEPAKPTGDLAALQGKWKAWLGAEDHVLFEVRDKSFTMTRHLGGRATEPWTGVLLLDEEPRPRHVTWVEGKCAGRDLPDNRCIYELHGDTWLLIGGGPDRRPEHFLSGEGEGSKTLVLKRQTAKE